MVLERVSSRLPELLHPRTTLPKPQAVAIGLFLLGVTLAILYDTFYLPKQIVRPGGVATVEAAPTPVEARDIPAPTNGVLFTATEAKLWQNRRPLAVVIENHTDARPQSGLSSAEIVYEALAEGGITRYLAIYLTTPANVTLGPIRSMRTYFLDWLEEYDSLAAHVGGNIDALDRIRPENVKDLDQFGLGSPTYSRVYDRFAPHNVYTSTDLLWAAAEKRGYSGPATFRSWKFQNESTDSARPSAQITRLGYLGFPSYKVTWNYSPENNSYLRTVGAGPAVDRNNGQQIAAKNVIVVEIPYTNAKTRIDELTLIMNDLGSGKAHILRDGLVVEGRWSKASRTARIIFTDSTGAEIPLNRGLIWVEVVPPGTPIEF